MNNILVSIIAASAVTSMVACAPNTPNDIPRPAAKNAQGGVVNGQAKGQLTPTPSKPTPSPSGSTNGSATGGPATGGTSNGSAASSPGGSSGGSPAASGSAAGGATAKKSGARVTDGAQAATAPNTRNEKSPVSQLNGRFELTDVFIYISARVGSSVRNNVSDLWETDLSVPGQISSSDKVTQQVQGSTQFDDTININLSPAITLKNGKINFEQLGLFQAGLSSNKPGIALFWAKPQYRLFTFATDKVLQTKPFSTGVYKLDYENQVPLVVQETVDKKTGDLTLAGSRLTTDENLQFQLVYQPAK